MLKSAPYYWVVCDGCEQRAEYYECSAWSEDWVAIEYAVDGDDWTYLDAMLRGLALGGDD